MVCCFESGVDATFWLYLLFSILPTFDFIESAQVISTENCSIYKFRFEERVLSVLSTQKREE